MPGFAMALQTVNVSIVNFHICILKIVTESALCHCEDYRGEITDTKHLAGSEKMAAVLIVLLWLFPSYKNVGDEQYYVLLRPSCPSLMHSVIQALAG